jgi:hypothetical protein
MRREPLLSVATLTGAATAIIALLVAFGVDFTDDQQAAILGVVAVAAPLVVGFAARSRVTPVERTPRPTHGLGSGNRGAISGSLVVAVALGVLLAALVLWALDVIVL